MSEHNSKIEELNQRLDKLLDMHNDVSYEIDNLRVEILRLKVEAQKSANEKESVEAPTIPEHVQEDIQPDAGSISDQSETLEQEIEDAPKLEENILESIGAQTAKNQYKTTEKGLEPVDKKKFDIEKLIGENLINKIGILILIIGVAIGAKYSIDNELISPLTRIILGYLTGIILLGLSIYLKKNYLNFSAVILSGAMAILYFITYFAFDFYQLISLEITFGLMVIFTIFTVLAALNYDKEVIAHLGLVGAISVPFLLGDDSGNVLFLFTYLALVNLAIAFISLKKNWKILFYSAFVLTWAIFFTWLGFDYSAETQFHIAFGFLTLFFILFYVIFIAYKFIKQKKYNAADVVILLLNSIVFFGIGYELLSENETGRQVLGLFALLNAFIHFIVAFLIHRRKLADRNLFYLVVGLVLACLTLAIPIQLEGRWITMTWAAEALILFIIGRRNNVPFYEYTSYVLIMISGISLTDDLNSGYTSDSLSSAFSSYSVLIENDFFINPIFLTSFIVIICFGMITWLHFKVDWRKNLKLDKTILKTMDFVIPIVFLFILFISIRMEILNYFDTQFIRSKITGNDSRTIFNYNYENLGRIWLLNYSLLFFSAISIFLAKKTHNKSAYWIAITFNFIIILSFLTIGLFHLSELRENYLSPRHSEYYNVDSSFLWLRYISIAALGLLTYWTYVLTQKVTDKRLLKVVTEVILGIIILWVTTSELIHWLDYNDNSENYGLALSIYWGIFSVAIIGFGIWKRKKHLRILGISIIAIAIIKLFAWDLSDLSTISKTIVMISLGASLLLTSFLYNKYSIEDEVQE